MRLPLLSFISLPLMVTARASYGLERRVAEPQCPLSSFKFEHITGGLIVLPVTWTGVGNSNLGGTTDSTATEAVLSLEHGTSGWLMANGRYAGIGNDFSNGYNWIYFATQEEILDNGYKVLCNIDEYNQFSCFVDTHSDRNVLQQCDGRWSLAANQRSNCETIQNVLVRDKTFDCPATTTTSTAAPTTTTTSAAECLPTDFNIRAVIGGVSQYAQTGSTAYFGAKSSAEKYWIDDQSRLRSGELLGWTFADDNYDLFRFAPTSSFGPSTPGMVPMESCEITTDNKLVCAAGGARGLSLPLKCFDQLAIGNPSYPTANCVPIDIFITYIPCPVSNTTTSSTMTTTTQATSTSTLPANTTTSFVTTTSAAAQCAETSFKLQFDAGGVAAPDSPWLVLGRVIGVDDDIRDVVMSINSNITAAEFSIDAGGNLHKDTFFTFTPTNAANLIAVSWADISAMGDPNKRYFKCSESNGLLQCSRDGGSPEPVMLCDEGGIRTLWLGQEPPAQCVQGTLRTVRNCPTSTTSTTTAATTSQFLNTTTTGLTTSTQFANTSTTSTHFSNTSTVATTTTSHFLNTTTVPALMTTTSQIVNATTSHTDSTASTTVSHVFNTSTTFVSTTSFFSTHTTVSSIQPPFVNGTSSSSTTSTSHSAFTTSSSGAFSDPHSTSTSVDIVDPQSSSTSTTEGTNHPTSRTYGSSSSSSTSSSPEDTWADWSMRTSSTRPNSPHSRPVTSSGSSSTAASVNPHSWAEWASLVEPYTSNIHPRPSAGHNGPSDSNGPKTITYTVDGHPTTTVVYPTTIAVTVTVNPVAEASLTSTGAGAHGPGGNHQSSTVDAAANAGQTAAAAGENGAPFGSDVKTYTGSAGRFGIGGALACVGFIAAMLML